jgi:type II secretory pathway predicted ATPase ExeA
VDGPSFGFRQHPFAETVDPDVFYRSLVHESARADLFTAIKTHGGLLILSGESGTGKTTVLQRVARDVERVGGRVLWCSDVAPLYETFALPGGQAGTPDATQAGAWRKELLAALQARVDLDGTMLVAVDEAQRLEPAELGALRDLAESRAAWDVPLAVLLVGQPELDVDLARLAGHGARQAFTFRAQLPRMETSEVRSYVAYRLGLAGTRPDDVFQAEAIDRVAAYANGVPRVINQLCDAALHTAHQAGLGKVSVPDVDIAARWLDLPPLDQATTRAARRTADREARAKHVVPADSGQRKIPAWTAGVGLVVLVAGFLYVFREESRPVGPRTPASAKVLEPERPPPLPESPGFQAELSRPVGPRAPASAKALEPERPPPLPEPPALQVLRPELPVAPGAIERHADLGAHALSERPVDLRSGKSSRKAVETPMPVPVLTPMVSGMARAILNAAEGGNLTEVRGLLTWGASPDSRDSRGMTPLMVAVIHGHGEVARLLLDQRADVNARDSGGVTPLMLAANNDRTVLLRALLDRGAHVNAQARDGWTALTYAAWKGYTDVARQLLTAGADPSLTDRFGWTALQYAMWRAAQTARAGVPDAADPPGVDDPGSTTAAHLRYLELVRFLAGVSSKR